MPSSAFARAFACTTLLVLFVACADDPTPLAPGLGASESRASRTHEGPHYSDWSEPVHIGSVVNATVADFDPHISRDGRSLFFSAGGQRGGAGGRDLWVAERATIDDPWGEPFNLGPVVNSAFHDSKPSLSMDGHLLYFASNRPDGLGGFDIWVSRRRNKRDNRAWEAPVNLGPGVNSEADEESRLSMFEDERTGRIVVYFASNRSGLGGFDIYRSTARGHARFGDAHLVPELSSPSDDADPSIRRDGREIYLASDRPGTLGGTDIWVATRAHTREAWSAPARLPEGINSPPRAPEQPEASDGGPSLSFDGTTLYFHSAFRPQNMSPMFDIWMSTRTRERGRSGKR